MSRWLEKREMFAGKKLYAPYFLLVMGKNFKKKFIFRERGKDLGK